MTTSILLAIAASISIIYNLKLSGDNSSLNAEIDNLNALLSGCLCPTGQTINRISTSEALEKIQRHQNRNVNSEITNNTDSVFVPWIDFLPYLTFAKNGMEGVGKEISGLEFYFAENGDTENYSTLVVYPTYLDTSRVRTDIEYSGHIPYDFIENDEVTNLYTNRSTHIDIVKVVNMSAAYNRMGQAPPRLPKLL